MFPSFTPARAVFVLLVLAAGLIVIGAVQFTEAERDRLRRAEGAELAATASGLAAALAPGSDVGAALEEAIRRENVAGAYFLDAVGRVVTERVSRRLDGVDWSAAVAPALGAAEAGAPVQRNWQGEVYWMAAAATPDGRRVVLLRPVAAEPASYGWVLVSALLLWLLVAAVAVAVLRLSRRPADLLEALARDLADSDDADAMGLVQKKFELRPLLGDRAKPLFDLGTAFYAERRRARDAQALANAFFQLGAHYVVLCSMDGRVLDANPAFFARTNMMPEWLRGQPTGVLEDILPMEPLMELAERSKHENAAISGVPYALDVEGTRRAVDVSLRTFPTSDGDAVLMILADRTKERTLEDQIDRYTDALDLMVDQRVAELAAGLDGLEPLLDDAGAAIVTFDRAGETQRFNGEAERLTGRTAFSLRRFPHFAAHVFRDESTREAFASWFWEAGGEDAFEAETPHGGRPVRWLKGERRQAGEVVERLLLGVSGLGVPERRAPSPSGDGLPDLGEIGAAEAGGDGYAFERKQT